MDAEYLVALWLAPAVLGLIACVVLVASFFVMGLADEFLSLLCQFMRDRSR